MFQQAGIFGVCEMLENWGQIFHVNFRVRPYWKKRFVQSRPSGLKTDNV